ncbi:hypothetical protein CVT25_010853 [Psilocybe cyanescens]|uniref:A to I editase domain-containing protein n=1 Tax=Psilocybe cyanescens TaxID=93625 RepID=A0A409WFM3_PSICY|nr:hypothetical protein CVT25_010853 [Psilocybe cyanescens]
MHLDQNPNLYDAAVIAILDAYSSFSYKPQHSQWTILASFFLTRRRSTPSVGVEGGEDEIKVISLATGTKCLPTNRFSPRGETVHDCHAEVLARRSALRWFLEEILRICSSDGVGSFCSAWIALGKDGKYAPRKGVHLNLYVSTLPCGDASMGYLASTQDETMAAMKSSSVFPELESTAASRGRDDYARLGVLRTKPGRADSPPTSCMSCSDKIAKWNVLGIQGALGSNFLSPLYIEAVIIGEVPMNLRTIARDDCERAFWRRLGEFQVQRPIIHFTDLPFPHSRSVLGSSTSCNESLCWSADSQPLEILINGLKRGVSPKHRYREKSSDSSTYFQAKLASSDYQIAKQKLLKEPGPFAGWIVSESHWQQFDINGEVQS